MKTAAAIYPDLKKIACPLLQAIYGGNGNVPSRFFDTELWQLHPIEQLPVLMVATNEQWAELAKRWGNKSVRSSNAAAIAELEVKAGIKFPDHLKKKIT